MNIELKKVSYSERNSHETYCYAADVFVNGKKVGYCENAGYGGCTFFHSYEKADKKTLSDFLDYCKNHNKYESIEIVLDELMDDWLDAKNANKLQKKLQKDMLRGIVHADKPQNYDSYDIYVWKTTNRVDLATVIEHRPDLVKNEIKRLKSNGRYILNTNIPKDLY